MRTARSASSSGGSSGGEQDVEDALGVGLHEAGEALEQRGDGGGGLLRRVLEEDVIAVGDLDEVVAAPAGLPLLLVGQRLHQDAGGVGRDAEGGCHRVFAHGLDDGGAERGAAVLEPAAHGAAVERHPEAGEPVLLTIERQAVTMLVDDDARDQRHGRERARQHLGRQRRGDDRGRLGRLGDGVWQSVLDARDDEATQPAALIGELVRLLAVDALGLALQGERLELGVRDLDAVFDQLELAQVTTTLGPGP